MTMADRHVCPVCGAEDSTVTIHDTLYFCGERDCGVHWDPTADDPSETIYYPVRGAIGFCPRCDANARGHETTRRATVFVCPECDYEWFDGRLDGWTLALRQGCAPPRERTNNRTV